MQNIATSGTKLPSGEAAAESTRSWKECISGKAQGPFQMKHAEAAGLKLCAVGDPEVQEERQGEIFAETVGTIH